MASFLLKRLGISALLLFTVSFITFLLVSLSPGDVAYTILGAYSTPDQLAALRKSMHLDQPIWSQYGHWVSNMLHGDFGRSLLTHQAVAQAVGERIAPTISLLVLTMLVTGLAGTALGVAGALRGGMLARVIDAIGLLGVAIPGFAIGLVLIIVFSVRIRLLPFGGYTSIGQGVGPWLAALALPVVALAIGSVGLVAKQVRSSMVDAMRSEFVRTFTANGFSRRSIIYRHALRSAAVPVLAVMGVTLVGMLGASVFIEQVFGIPGIGGLAVQASLQKDLPVVQAVAVVYTLIVIAVNLLLDVLYAVVNPKVSVR